VMDDNPLIEFTHESGPYRKTGPVREVQRRLIGSLVTTSNHVHNALLLLANELRRPNPSQGNFACEGPVGSTVDVMRSPCRYAHRPLGRRAFCSCSSGERQA